MRPTVKLAHCTDELRRLSGMLADELLQWPEVGARPMFGLRAFYRGPKIFAMLPDKRGFETPGGVAYKQGKKWSRFELRSEGDLNGALACLTRAYTAAVSS